MGGSCWMRLLCQITILEKLDAPGILGLHFLDVEAPPAIEVAISGKPAKGSTHAAVRYAWPHREYAARKVSTSSLVPDVSRRTHPS